MKNFRSYWLAVQLYRLLARLSPPRHLRDQLERAAASVCLNLAEGYGRRQPRDKRHFYQIALGSLREVQAILELAQPEQSEAKRLADQLGGALYRLCSAR
jgi:four helix bundle protein